MIDTHTHVLPGMDDGPARLAASTAMAARLVEAGVEHILCTPHRSKRFPTDHREAVFASKRLARSLALSAVRVQLTVAAEFSPLAAMSEPLGELRRRSIADRFVLVEMAGSTSSRFPLAVLARLQPADLIPIVAHPERCRAVQRNVRILDPLRRAGALIQVVAPSLVGSRQDVSDTAWRIVDSGRADLVASDAHRPWDASLLQEAVKLISNRLGAAASHILTEDTPRLVLAGRHPAERY